MDSGLQQFGIYILGIHLIKFDAVIEGVQNICVVLVLLDCMLIFHQKLHINKCLLMLEILFVDLNYFTKFRYDSMNITAFNV